MSKGKNPKGGGKGGKGKFCRVCNKSGHEESQCWWATERAPNTKPNKGAGKAGGKTGKPGVPQQPQAAGAKKEPKPKDKM
eukprot:2510873-Amphidinium_carterae.1